MATQLKKEIVLDVPSLMFGNNVAQAKEDKPFTPVGGIGVVQPNITKETGINAGGLGAVQPNLSKDNTPDLASVTGLTGEARTNALKALIDELAKRTGVDISKLIDSSVVVDSSQIKNQESETKKEEVDTKQQEIKDLTTEAGKLKIQSDIKAYKDALGITTPKPIAKDSVADYTKLRTDYGLAGLDTQLTDINDQITKLTSDFKSTSTGLEGQGRGITSGIVRGQQGKLDEQYQNQLQTLEMKKNNIATQISNANSVISTIMGLKQTDYANASNDYNAQFSQQLQLASALNSQADDSKKDANANLNVVLNGVKGTAWDELDTTSQVAIQKLALQSGIDESLVKALVDNQDIAELMATSEGYDADGNEIKTFFYKGKDGKTGVIESIATGGVSSTTRENKEIPDIKKTLEALYGNDTWEKLAKESGIRVEGTWGIGGKWDIEAVKEQYKKTFESLKETGLFTDAEILSSLTSSIDEKLK